MSAPTSGGVTVKTLSGRSAAGLLGYREGKDKQEKEPYLFATTRHCAHDTATAIQEWQRTRVEHGTQGAVRRVKGRYETVDPATGLHATRHRGTHVREWDGKRYRKRPVRDNEIPTHYYVAPDALTPLERESEATHTIYAAGADLVNREDHEALEQFFLAVKAERDEHYPGLQESMWLERNGESGLVHVHVASNATIYADFELDGVEYKAGQKMAGGMTKVDNVRARFERYLDAHPEHGLKQSLPRVGTAEYESAQKRDGQKTYWEAARGKETAQEKIRRITAEVMIDTGAADRAAFIAEMKTRGVEVAEVGLRRGKPGMNHDYGYRLASGKQVVRGRTLGAMYDYYRIGAQLDRKAAGKELLPYPGVRAVEAKPHPFERQPLTAAEQAELDQLRTAVQELADDERGRQALEASAAVTAPRATAQQPTMDDLAERVAREVKEREAGLMPTGATDEDIARLFPWRAAAEGQEAAEQSESPAAVQMQPRRRQPAAAETASAPAPSSERAPVTETAAASAPAAALNDELSTEQPYRSRLRGIRAKGGSAVVQARIQMMAALDERYREQRSDAALEASLTKVGVGNQFIREYGEHLSPEVRELLVTREAAKAHADRQFQLSKVQDDYRDAQAIRQRQSKIRGRIKDGDYDGAVQLGERFVARDAQTEQPQVDAAPQMSAARQRAMEKRREQMQASRKNREQEESQGYDGPSM